MYQTCFQYCFIAHLEEDDLIMLADQRSHIVRLNLTYFSLMAWMT
jgi:hypothetical protein